MADVDGDGNLDIVVANFDTADLVLPGRGDGTVEPAIGLTAPAGENGSLDVAIGDVDGNGTLDLVFANFRGGNQVWLGDGQGGFAKTNQAIGDAKTGGLKLGDLDGDGDLDAFAANIGPNRVWLNSSAPLASAGGPYVVNEGDSLVLDASATIDHDNDILQYEWDFEYDGVTFDVDATGVSPTFPTTDGTRTFNVGLRVSDHMGFIASDTTTVTIANVAPVPTIAMISVRRRKGRPSASRARPVTRPAATTH